MAVLLAVAKLFPMVLTITFFLVSSCAGFLVNGVVDDVILDSTTTVISKEKIKQLNNKQLN